MADEKKEPEYLGDGVYITEDIVGVKLFTHNGIQALDTIYIEKDVYRRLRTYCDHLFAI